jgi:hypothetical protein
MIPIKLTAVAANEDMGVMTWLLGQARSVPQNYFALELNEARINWFNPALNYESVVTAAADDAGGQGFVTEFADSTAVLANTAWSPYDDSTWERLRNGVYTRFDQIFDAFYGQYGAWDGFWDAVRTSVTLPADLPFADFQLCPTCYADDVEFSPSGFITELETSVIEPVRLVQRVIDEHPYVTRLYSTLSAAEMTADPLFTFNPDLETVSNVHTAERIIECNPSIYQSQASWRIELPQGGVVRGTAAQTGTWPDFEDQPATFRILRQGETGDGRVVEDNGGVIEDLLDAYNDSLPNPTGTGGATGTGGTTATGGATGLGGTNDADATRPRGDSDCSMRHGSGSSLPWAALALLLLSRRVRSRKASS